jgi:hypothetical protein
MKYGMILGLFLSCLLFFVSTHSRRRNIKGKSNDSFLETCKDMKLEGNNLVATCQKENQETWINTKLNLDECLAFINGRFEWKQNGSFSKTTKNCRLNTNAGQITCRGKFMSALSSTYNLIDTVSNFDGFLVCDGLNSTRFEIPTGTAPQVQPFFTQTQTQTKPPSNVKSGSNY